MRITNSAVFIDSSMLIEAAKGNKTALLKQLVDDGDNECFISSVVVSEFLFHFLAMNATVAPLTLKMRGDISVVMQENIGYEMMRSFRIIEGGADLVALVPSLMQAYNLLPNDAIILATCKIHQIKNIASHDSDFRLPCNAEGINFITE